MNSTLGQGLVLVALLICAAGAPIGFAAGRRRSATGLAVVRWLSLAFFASMLLACLVMWRAILTHDFSVSYVAQVGSRATPFHIAVASLWSSLEGSILLWGLVLGIYVAAVAFLQRRGHEHYLAYTLATLLSIGLYFTLLIAGPANPFAPTPAPIPTDGPGPNAVLQNHFLMLIHPPVLYFGYVGMSVPFSMAVAALLRGQLGATWLKPLRNWLLVPVAFLSAGIMLGGWWAYEVLGWGGYWAWDPVENASFLPWLTGIAAVHSAIVLQRRGTLKAWTVILILVSFLLTILGTFLTRSGTFNSVHSFTQSPIGPLFLIFLGVASVFVVILLALRINTLVGEPAPQPLASRETAFLANNLVFLGITFTVLVGTLFPIISEAVRGVKVSVGEPYFNRMAVPLFLSLLLLMGVGPALPWGSSKQGLVRRVLLRPLPAAFVSLVLVALFGGRSPYLLLTAAFVGYSLWVTFDHGLRPTRARRARGESAATALLTSTRLAPRRLGGYLAHFGVIIVFLAIALSSSQQRETEGTLSLGDSLAFEKYGLTLESVRQENQPHVSKQIARIAVTRNGRPLRPLEPSLNQYPTMRDPIGTPAVRTFLTHDLYLTLMSTDSSGRIGLRAIVTPAVAWIWIGVFILVAGTLLCLVPARRPKEAP